MKACLQNVQSMGRSALENMPRKTGHHKLKGYKNWGVYYLCPNCDHHIKGKKTGLCQDCRKLK